MNYHYRFLKEETVIVSSVGYISPLQELYDLAGELRSKSYSGDVLFDLLCVNGNTSSNRFVSMKFDGKHFERQESITLEQPDNNLLEIQNKFYQQHQSYILSSVLSSDKQRLFITS